MTCKCDEPHLGLATTRELLDELRARIETMSPGGLDYRTVGGEEIVARGKCVESVATTGIGRFEVAQEPTEVLWTNPDLRKD